MTTFLPVFQKKKNLQKKKYNNRVGGGGKLTFLSWALKINFCIFVVKYI